MFISTVVAQNVAAAATGTIPCIATAWLHNTAASVRFAATRETSACCATGANSNHTQLLKQGSGQQLHRDHTSSRGKQEPWFGGLVTRCVLANITLVTESSTYHKDLNRASRSK
jgi:hypothetical protein